MKLTEKQRTLLDWTARACDEYDGIAPHGAGQWSTMYALERAGLVERRGPAECGEDCERAGDCPHPVQLFALSAAGHKFIDDPALSHLHATTEGT